MAGEKFEYGDLVTSVALCPPACRLVFVKVWCPEEGDGVEPHHSFLPVVAVRSTVANCYVGRKPAGGRPARRYATHREMLEYGWEFLMQKTDDALLVLDDDADGDLAATDDRACYPRGGNFAYRVCPAPWPPGEDEERLRPVVEELLDQVRELRADPAAAT
jgi:hypothetical protein